MALKKLTFTLGDTDGALNLRALTAALENTLDMLRRIEANIVQSGVDVSWEVVQVRKASPFTMTVAPKVTAKASAPKIAASKRRSIGNKIVQACADGVAQLQKSPTVPLYFDEEALIAARQLVKSAGNGALTISTSQNGKAKHEIKLTDQAIANIDEIATKARKYKDVGTVEGRLEEISVHGAPEASPQIRIWDPIPLPGRAVKCVINQDRLPEVKDLLGQRVSVSGLIKYENHKPTSIDVQSIRRLRTHDELPQIESMDPIDITGDLTTEEHIRRLRDGE